VKKFIIVMSILCITLSIFASCGDDDIESITSEVSTINMEQKTLNLADENVSSRLKIQGRYAVIENEGITFDWTGSTLECNAYCMGDVSIAMILQSLVQDNWNCYFTVFVDGTQQERVELQSSSLNPEIKSLTIASGLEEGNHSFKIVRQTESALALVTFRSLSVSGELTERPKDNDLYIEFYGDSIAVGLGNLILNTNGPESFYPINQDGTLSYPYMTAQALGADVSIVARTGIGVKKGWDDGNPDMISVYPYTNFYRNKTNLWSFERKADIISINLGTNDCWLGLSSEDLQAAMVEFLTMVRQDNPNAKIVWVVGGMEHLYETQATNAIEECGGADKGFYVFKMSIAEKNGGKMHPYYTEYPKLVDELTEFLRELLNQ